MASVPPAPLNLTWDQAIQRVLGEAGTPLHYTDIAERIIAGGLRATFGATPSTTVNVTLSDSINKGMQKYVRLGDGLYALRTWVNQSTQPTAEPIAEVVQRASDSGAVNAFGMFWRRDWVNWDSPNIIGKQDGADLTVNFNDQLGVYLLHDRDRVIYVGRAEEGLVKRLRAHTTGRFGGRWDRFSWFGIRAVFDDGTLQPAAESWVRSDVIETMEAVLIECLEPSQNRKRGDNLGQTEFLQVLDQNFRQAEARRLLDQLIAKNI